MTGKPPSTPDKGATPATGPTPPDAEAELRARIEATLDQVAPGESRSMAEFDASEHDEDGHPR